MNWTPILPHPDHLLEGMIQVGRDLRAKVRAAFQRDPDLARADSGIADLQYPIDRIAEEDLEAIVEAAFPHHGIHLLTEGGPLEGRPLKSGDDSIFLVIDPIDGTRGLMHDKRSAWILLGAARMADAQSLRALDWSVMMELPTSRSTLSDVLAVGPGVCVAYTEDLRTGKESSLPVRPSTASTLGHGFATINRFLWSDAEIWGRFQDAFLGRVAAQDTALGGTVFEDQYICNGGQMHGLITGRDRFVADLRPLACRLGHEPLCSHPYDLVALPIAEAAGVVVTDARGRPLDAPLDLTSSVAWVGYASRSLREFLEPHLLATIQEIFATD